ncbi:MAG: hypothetical protein AAGF31_00930 [Planctomycetota bacterium]
MDAHPRCRTRRCAAVLALALTVTFISTESAQAAGHRTTNFVVQAPTRALAIEIAQSAEQWRERLAIEWLGEAMPAWSKPCPIQASVSPHLGAGGETSFVFDQGEVFGWTMKVQGSRERVLDSVLPHEITHTIFASHFRRPLPRWADEGACTTVEHPVEIGKQERMLIRFLKTGKGIPFTRMFALKEYPRDVMPLYSQGHSVTTFLIERRGKKAFLEFLADGMADEQWAAAVREHYGHDTLYAMQDQWLAWVKQGRPRLALEPDVATVAANTAPAPTDRSRGGGVALASATTPDAMSNASAAFGDSAESVYSAMAETPARTSQGGSIYDASRGSRTLYR